MTYACAQRAEGAWCPYSQRGRQPPATCAPPYHPAILSLHGRAAIAGRHSSFVGRQKDLRALVELVASTGLVTVVGPPGVGKTRLAIEFAQFESGRFADGAIFLDLAHISAADSVVTEIVQQMGLSVESDVEGVDGLARAIGSRAILLILDNCEHVIEQSARVCAALLECCSGVAIIATSREPLRVDGELIWQLAPLALPDQRATLRELRTTDSVALFVHRASARRPAFALSEGNKSEVAAICEQVDGLPLAIELAAALVGSLALTEIAAGLANALELLVRGSRLVDRHRTLRAAIDWSHSLLSHQERTALLRMSVFPGDFDLSAATAVCDDTLPPQGGARSLIFGLTEKSLLQTVPHGEHLRYRLLVPLRQFCLEQMSEAGDATRVNQRHLSYYTSLAENAEPSLMSGQRDASLQAIEVERYNIRAALEWGLGSTEPTANDMAARLAAALLWYFAVTGHLADGMSWLERAERLGASLAPETRARVLCTGGELAWLLGEELGRAWLEESLCPWRSLEERRRVAYCLQALSFLVDPELGREQAQQSIAIFRSVHDAWGEALAIHTLGMVESQQGDPEEGRARLEDALRRYQELGDSYLMVQVLNLLGDLDRNEDSYELARVHYEVALATLETSDYLSNRPSVLQNLGFVSLHLGDNTNAFERFREAVEVFSEEGDLRGLAESLTGIAAVLARQKDPELAAIIVGAADKILADANTTVWRSNRDDTSAIARDLLARLGGARFAELRREGEALQLREVVRRSLAKDRRRPGASADQRGAPLSPREQEVAILVARGYRNRQIAETMVITEGTARLHVKHILRRLAFSSRAEVAAWAVAHGLLGEGR